MATNPTKKKKKNNYDNIGIIDVWAQPPRQSMILNMQEVRPLFEHSHSPAEKWIKDAQEKTNKNPPASFIISQMDKSNIDKVMLCAWDRPNRKHLITNEEILNEFVSLYPKRFLGICSVNLNNPLEAVKTIDYYIGKKGFKGVRVVPWLWDKPPTHRYYYPIYIKCIEYNVPFLTQVGHTGPLCPSEVGRPIPYIDQIALDFPDLKIICGHIGMPWVNEMIGVAWKHKNVYIDTSAWLPAYYPKPLIHYINSYGKYKVMFGTNYPQLTYAACASQAKKLPINKKSMELFLRGNAARVFGLDNDNKNGSQIESKL